MISMQNDEKPRQNVIKTGSNGTRPRACSLEFEPCVIMNELDDLITLGMILSNQQEAARVGNRTICLDLRPEIRP